MLDTLKPTLTNKYLNRMMRAHSEFNKFKDYTEKEREHLIEDDRPQDPRREGRTRALPDARAVSDRGRAHRTESLRGAVDVGAAREVNRQSCR